LTRTARTPSSFRRSRSAPTSRATPARLFPRRARNHAGVRRAQPRSAFDLRADTRRGDCRGAPAWSSAATLRWAAVEADHPSLAPTNPWHQRYADITQHTGKNPAKSAGRHSGLPNTRYGLCVRRGASQPDLPNLVRMLEARSAILAGGPPDACGRDRPMAPATQQGDRPLEEGSRTWGVPNASASLPHADPRHAQRGLEVAARCDACRAAAWRTHEPFDTGPAEGRQKCLDASVAALTGSGTSPRAIADEFSLSRACLSVPEQPADGQLVKLHGR
jgi:hypothetical protein